MSLPTVDGLPAGAGQATSPGQREQFLAALRGQLRASRRRQRLTQTQLAGRTDGLVSKAALANYETGHRSLRVEVYWALARSLGEDSGRLISAAELAVTGPALRIIRRGRKTVAVRVADVLASNDRALMPIQRWFAARYPHGVEPDLVEHLDQAALTALADLLGMTAAECSQHLRNLSAHSAEATDRTRSIESEAMRRGSMPLSAPSADDGRGRR